MSAIKTAPWVITFSLCLATAAIGAEPPVEWDGLYRSSIKGIDVAYVRPGVDLAQYSKVMLDPVEVSFAKNWRPERSASQIRLTQEDRDRIKNDLSALTAETFKETLMSKDGYPVVTAAGPEVMRVTAALVDVYINAPDVMSAGRSRTYVMNAGRMTLFAELRDSETGALFARVVDAREARTGTTLQWANEVKNSAEARNAVRQWATILRNRLDAVRAQQTE